MNGNVEQVLHAARALYAGDRQTAIRLARPLARPSLLEGRAKSRVTHAFGSALVSRIEGGQERTGNLYQSKAGPAEMLNAFQVLVERTPLIRFGYLAANAALHRETRGAAKLHVVDVGIGHGRQWLPFMDGFRCASGRNTSMRLTGIEVNGAEEGLRNVGKELHAKADLLRLPFEFSARSGLIEEMDGVGAREGETLAINAAFALHHVPDSDAIVSPEKSRDAVISRLRALSPGVVTLVEPDSEHNALPLPERVKEAFAHYGLLFDVFEELLAHDTSARKVIEQAFFAREVHNIVVGEGPARVERHERHTAWTRRMKRHGFLPLDLSDLKREVTRKLDLQDPFSIAMNDGALSLSWKGERLVTASAWRCAERLDA